MTTTQAQERGVQARLTFGGILRSEWIKLTSLRSTIWSYVIIVILTLGFGLLLALTVGGEMGAPGGGMGGDENYARSLTVTICTAGLMLGQLVASVLGVLMISGEYSTGMVRSTLAAIPTRLPMLWAKTIVLFVTTTLVGLVTVLLTFFATAPIRASHDLHTDLFHPDLLFALLGAALYLGLVSVFALGVGTLVRSTAGGIAAALGVLLVLPTLLLILSTFADWANDVIPYLISNAGQAMFTIPQELPSGFEPPSIPLEPGMATLVVLAWAAVAIALGALGLRRRDA